MAAFCRGFAMSAGLQARSFDTTPMSDLPYLPDIGFTVLAQSLVSVD